MTSEHSYSPAVIIWLFIKGLSSHCLGVQGWRVYISTPHNSNCTVVGVCVWVWRHFLNLCSDCVFFLLVTVAFRPYPGTMVPAQIWSSSPKPEDYMMFSFNLTVIISLLSLKKVVFISYLLIEFIYCTCSALIYQKFSIVFFWVDHESVKCWMTGTLSVSEFKK